jgi:hypothetical protein
MRRIGNSSTTAGVYDIDRSPVVLGAWVKAWDTTRMLAAISSATN